MKTMAEFASTGMSSLSEVQVALQLAMRLEFATLPPYLCAEWSVDTNNDRDGVANAINSIAEQEMYHFALAGNILTAIRGIPDVARPDFVPSYPTNELPGGIQLPRPVDLRPLSQDQAEVFLLIENPEFPPVALLLAPPPGTIGEFYSRLAEALIALKPDFDLNAHNVLLKEATPIRSLKDAVDAISLIKEEGEGSQTSPYQMMAGGKLAHYYAFKEIAKGRRFNPATGHFDGDEVRMPPVGDFHPAPQGGNEAVAFNRKLTELLKALQACWTSGAKVPVGTMFELRSEGKALITKQIRPEFKWAD